MPTMPSKRSERISFCEAHATPWLAHAGAIGVTPAEVTALADKTAAARAAFNAQQAAQNAARAATATYHRLADEMAHAAQAIIDQVHVQASATGGGVYPLAQIPAIAAPSPIGELGRPTDFAVALDQRGVLNLKWKCTNPPNASGVVYQVWRRLRDGGNGGDGGDPEGDFTYVGQVGAKKYADADVPAGTAQVQYRVQAVRSTGVGPVALFIVNFGAAAPVVMAAPRLAA